LQLLNFSLDSVGLANWWSILTRFVAPQNYQLDGIVFVVSEWDLEGKFAVAEHQGSHLTWRRCPSWDPKTYPTTLEETTACPNSLTNAYILSHSQFEQALKKEWPPSIPRTEVRPALASQVLDYFERLWDFRQEAPALSPRFDPEQARLMEDIRLFISSRKLPALVVFLPTRDRLVRSTWENDPHRAETMAFAEKIGARFVDGSEAFANMPSKDIRKCFFPYDPDWNQNGSDRFAKFMLDLIPRGFPDQLQASR